MPPTGTPVPLFADVAIPLVALTLPTMLALLVPIIAIEAYLCKRWLGLGGQIAALSSTTANVVSTIIGIPIAWFAAFWLESGAIVAVSRATAVFHRSSPLAAAIELMLGLMWASSGDSPAFWMVACAVLMLLVPFYLVSYGIEYLMVRWVLSAWDVEVQGNGRISRAVRDSNLVTYGLLAAGMIGWLAWLSRP